MQQIQSSIHERSRVIFGINLNGARQSRSRFSGLTDVIAYVRALSRRLGFIASERVSLAYS